jgi:hypothetical protein
MSTQRAGSYSTPRVWLSRGRDIPGSEPAWCAAWFLPIAGHTFHEETYNQRGACLADAEEPRLEATHPSGYAERVQVE